MADDIVTRLRKYRIPKHATLRERPIVCHEAADEIERLHALCSHLGVALDHLRHGCTPFCDEQLAECAYPQADAALLAWEEARRG